MFFFWGGGSWYSFWFSFRGLVYGFVLSIMLGFVSFRFFGIYFFPCGLQYPIQRLGWTMFCFVDIQVMFGDRFEDALLLVSLLF